VIERCTVRDYNGDGISFQQCNDVTVVGCVCENNAGLGLHPGSGSQRPIVKQCLARANGGDGLFLCWRVKQGVFEDNVLEDNGEFGISIGHKDTDNLIRHNQVRRNRADGIYFRNECEGLAGNRNRLDNNLVENNGIGQEAAGIRVRGETHDLVFKDNIIRDTRAEPDRKQTTGIRIEDRAGAVVLEGNQIEAAKAVDDQRQPAK
jgi:nitrous oxidase accessory protein NosD